MIKKLKIGELAQASGSTIDTIRFYENKGLVLPGERSASGYRHYNLESISVLKFIQMCKELGFTLAEIKELLEIKIEKGGKCSLAFEKIKSKESEIDVKINDLKKIKRAIQKITKICSESDGEKECHFLDLIK
jgi:DNA-binding transcriptional MerR regulator